jgi:hypothetical protein
VLTAPHCEAALTPRGPIAYAGQQALSADLANFKAALAKVKATEVMNPSSALSRAHQSIRRLHAIEGGKRLLHFDRRWEIGHAVDD